MPIITLTTDLGLDDHYVGALKGSIYSIYPEAVVVDITHNIPAFHTITAAFVLKNSYYRFPKGSIHVLGVNPDLKEDSDFLAILYNEHYFIGTNNGIFSLIFDQKPDKLVKINIPREDNYLSFPLGDILIKAACHLAKGGTLEFIGNPVEHMLEKTAYRAISQGNTIRGIVIHVDRYGNAISNIDEHFFNSFGKNRKFSIEISGSSYDINKISATYNDESDGEKLAIFSSSKLLEIAINNGDASKLLGLRIGSGIRIEFYDN